MRLRLRNIDSAITGQAQSKESERGRDASITSSGTVTPPHGPSKDVPEDVQRNNLGFAFEEDLLASRVYRKPLFSKSGESFVTSAVRTTAWSILSGISLTDVSNISVLAVPIYAHEISNSARYIFGDIQPESLTVEDREAASNAVQQTPRIDWMIGYALLHEARGNATKRNTLRQREPKVLSVPLQDLIKYNNVPISLTNEKGANYTYGYVPVFVAKTGAFLKKSGQSVSNHKVHTSSLTMYTQPRLSKIYLASAGQPVAFQYLKVCLIVPRVMARESIGLAARFTTQHAYY